jgi:hypothetical protein
MYVKYITENHDEYLEIKTELETIIEKKSRHVVFTL